VHHRTGIAERSQQDYARQTAEETRIVVTRGVRLVVWSGLVAGWTAGAIAQTPVVQTREASITLTGRVQTQFNTTSVSGEPFSAFLVRRARATVDVEVNDFVSGRIMPDFGEGSVKLRDAYAQLTFDPTFRLTFGQFKRPFDLFQLTSSTQILVIERAGDIRGVSACAGPGGVCSLSRLSEKLQFSDRDIGIMVDGSSGETEYAFAVQNGVGANLADENGTKSYTGRVRVGAGNDLRIGGNVGLHDYVKTAQGSDDYALAGGADIEIGNFTEGLHVQAGIITGQNWANPDVGGNASTFLAAQAIIAWKSPVANSRMVSHLEPLARISLADPDTDMSNDGGVLLTPGFVVHFAGRNKIAANIDIYVPGTGGTEWGLKFQSYLHY
jgi:hypothetical protein